MVNFSVPDGTILDTWYNSIMKTSLLALLLFGLATATGCSGGGGNSVARDATPAPTSATPAPARDNLPKIVAFGDSLTAGYGLEPRQSYPSLLQQKLDADGYRYEVVNAGVSGDTSAGGLRRIDWSLEGNVRLLVLELGANDHLRGQPVAETQKNLSEIIARAKARGVEVVLAGMLTTTNAGDRYQREIYDMYQTLGREPGVTFIPFFLEGVAGQETLNQPDGVHPNPEGTKLIAETVYKAIKPLLERDRQKSG